MFTGLITEVGTVGTAGRGPGGLRLALRAPATARGLEIGGSVAVNGVCLTAVEVERAGFSADVIPETLRRTTLGGLAPGDRVNLERPVQPRTELGGHFVQGHIDGVARVKRIGRTGDEVILEVELPRSLQGLLVEKGSIAIDGVSLTVAKAGRGRFSVCLIPHTLKATTLGELGPGGAVNLEADILAKYVRSLMRGRRRTR